MFRMKSIQLNLYSAQYILKREIHRKNSHYESLGLTPKASHADIKQAFYKLSMEFHPDKATGDDSKFRKINAAYEILGNLKLRRMYDKGLLPTGVATHRDLENDVVYENETPFSEQTSYAYEKPRRKPMSGKTSEYNYDEWTRSHYADTFTRSKNFRSRRSDMEGYRFGTNSQEKIEKTLCVLGFLVFSMFYYSHLYLNWDVPRKRRIEEQEED